MIKNLQNKPKLFWVGPMIPSENLDKWLSASPAAMKWQKHLLDALIKEGADLEWLYYRPDSYWPKGRLLPGNEIMQSNITYSNKQIRYVNFPGFRNLSKKKKLCEILQNISTLKSDQPLIIISYNAPSWIENAFADSDIRSKFTFIYLIADQTAPKGADGYIFLNYDFFQRYNGSNNKLHLDGAVYPQPQDKFLKKTLEIERKTIFFYSGSLGKWGGVKILLDAMTLIKRDDFELWISGFGDVQAFKKSLPKDNRIKYLGLLNEDQLCDKYQAANVFLNPRPINMLGNDNNFPSKLFDYLAWNKPIISTWSNGFSPEYRKVLDIVEDNALAFSTAMTNYIAVKSASMNQNEKWLQEKTWKKQAINLLSFLNKISYSIDEK